MYYSIASQLSKTVVTKLDTAVQALEVRLLSFFPLLPPSTAIAISVEGSIAGICALTPCSGSPPI